MADPKMEIILAARDVSKQAFDDVRRNVNGIGQSFAQLKTVIGGLALGGAIAAIRKALDFAEQGAAIEKQIAAFDNLSKSVGVSSQEIIKNLKMVSRGFVSEAEIVKSAGTAMMLGIPADRLTELMRIAEATARQTGQSVTEAFSDISIGVARQSKLILDNLGIIVEVEKANERYAKALGKTSSELTEAEKRQAFMNDVLRSGGELVQRIGASSGELDSINRLIASQSNLWSEVLRTIAQITAKELPAYVKAIDWVTERLKSMQRSMGEATKADAWKEIEMLRSLEAKGMAQPGLAAAKEAEFNRRFMQQQYNLRASEEMKRLGSFQTPVWNPAAWRELEGNWADYTEAEKKAMVEANEKLRKEVSVQAKKNQDAVKSIWEGWGVRPYTESEAFLADEKAFEEFRKKWQDFDQRPFQESESVLADQKTFEEWKKKTEDGFNAMVQLSERTAEAMQENFSDLFFDAFTGKLKSIEDYAKAVFTSIQRAAADMAGQMATEALFGGMKSGQAGQGSTGLIGDFLALFTSSGGPEQLGQFARGGVFMPGGLQRFADGGVVSRPTVFPFARGTGLMGESGPEAIMPLKRLPGGKLGVESTSGAAHPVITINVQAPRGRVDRDSLSEIQAGIYSTLVRSARRNT